MNTQIPKDLVKLYCQLVGANPKSRPSPSKFLEVASTGFLKNDFVKSMQFIEEIQVGELLWENGLGDGLGLESGLILGSWLEAGGLVFAKEWVGKQMGEILNVY